MSDEDSSYDIVTPAHDKHKPDWEEYTVADGEVRETWKKYYEERKLPPIMNVRVCRNCWRKK